MKYVIDHDYHIHSQLSLCSNDPAQTPWRMLQYAAQHGLTSLCLTDHFWDEAIPGALGRFYQEQTVGHIKEALPLPQSEGVRFYFGGECDVDRFGHVTVTKETCDAMDFIVVPTTHLHLGGQAFPFGETRTPSERAALWVERFDVLLNSDLPLHKMGLAHLACPLMDNTSRENYITAMSLLPEEEMYRQFTKAAAVGLGIELNAGDMKYSDEEADVVLRPFRIAKECGCKFYLGSDAHHPDELDSAIPLFRKGIDALGLQESDKYHIPR